MYRLRPAIRPMPSTSENPHPVYSTGGPVLNGENLTARIPTPSRQQLDTPEEISAATVATIPFRRNTKPLLYLKVRS